MTHEDLIAMLALPTLNCRMPLTKAHWHHTTSRSATHVQKSDDRNFSLECFMKGGWMSVVVVDFCLVEAHCKRCSPRILPKTIDQLHDWLVQMGGAWTDADMDRALSKHPGFQSAFA